MRRILSKLDSIFKEHKTNLGEKLEKIIARNNLSLNPDDVKKKFDIEYEILSLDSSTTIDSEEKSELTEKLRHIESLVRKVVENVLSGYPHKIRVSLKLKTILAEYSAWDLKILDYLYWSSYLFLVNYYNEWIVSLVLIIMWTLSMFSFIPLPLGSMTMKMSISLLELQSSVP